MSTAARGSRKPRAMRAPPDELLNTARLILWEHQRVQRSLANLYPDLAA
jgi:hypothetical protein